MLASTVVVMHNNNYCYNRQYIYACIKHHINDCAVHSNYDTCLRSTITIEHENVFRRNFQIGHVAAKRGTAGLPRPRAHNIMHNYMLELNEHAHAYPDGSCDSLNLLPKKLVTCVAASLARPPKRRHLE